MTVDNGTDHNYNCNTQKERAMNKKTYPGQCAGDDACPKPIVILKRQMCWNHYTRLYRRQREEKCSLDWCSNSIYAKTLCQYHWQRQRDGLPLINRKAPNPPCSFEECDRESKSLGLCSSHYMQQYLGKPLTPIREYITDGVSEGGRRCKTCKEVKDEEKDFYKRSGGVGPQTECKTCQTKRNRRNTLIREGRLEEAALV